MVWSVDVAVVEIDGELGEALLAQVRGDLPLEARVRSLKAMAVRVGSGDVLGRVPRPAPVVAPVHATRSDVRQECEPATAIDERYEDSEVAACLPLCSDGLTGEGEGCGGGGANDEDPSIQVWRDNIGLDREDAGFIDTDGDDGAKVAMIITDGEPLDQEAAGIQRQVTALVHQDVKVYWITVGVLGSGKRAPVGATPITLSDPDSFADDVIRTIVNETRLCGIGADGSIDP